MSSICKDCGHRHRGIAECKFCDCVWEVAQEKISMIKKIKILISTATPEILLYSPIHNPTFLKIVHKKTTRNFLIQIISLRH